MKGKISEITITLTSKLSRVTIDNAIEFLESARHYDPDARVDVIIYHVVREIEIKE